MAPAVASVVSSTAMVRFRKMAVFFIFSGHVAWLAAVIMAVGALIGGSLGGRLAGRVKLGTLRRIVVIIGILVAIIYLVRGR